MELVLLLTELALELFGTCSLGLEFNSNFSMFNWLMSGGLRTTLSLFEMDTELFFSLKLFLFSPKNSLTFG